MFLEHGENFKKLICSSIVGYHIHLLYYTPVKITFYTKYNDKGNFPKYIVK